MIARILALIVGTFYTLSGGWAFFFPHGFFSTVATFAPYNLHLLHDAGAFQVGLGVVLLVAAATDRGMIPAAIGVLAGSVLHLVAHVVDISLGGHPATDLPALTLIVVALALAVIFALRKKTVAGRS